jgi:hypothetical protein
LIITLAWTISVYDADADLYEDTYKNIYKFSLKQSKGTGASGSFKIGEVVKPKKKPAANSPFKGYPNSSKRI